MWLIFELISSLFLSFPPPILLSEHHQSTIFPEKYHLHHLYQFLEALASLDPGLSQTQSVTLSVTQVLDKYAESWVLMSLYKSGCIMMSHDVSYWVMMCYDESWCIMKSHDVSCWVIICHNKSWYVLISHNLSCFVVRSHDVSYWVMMCYD